MTGHFDRNLQIDTGNKTNPALFMGDCARINTDLRKLKSISSYSYNQKLEKISTSSPEQYRSWFQELQQKDKDAVVALKGVLNICAKAIQVKLMEIDYRYTTDMMSYSIDLQVPTAKKITYRQLNEIPAKAGKLDASYYNFLTNELVNNPLAVLVSEYYFFYKQVNVS